MPTWFVDDLKLFSPPPTRSSARLVVTAEHLSGEALVGLVGLAPDERWERGDQPHARGRFAGYKLSSRLPETASPSAHLTDLLERIQPIASRIRELANDDRVAVRIWLGHHIANSNPGLSLSTEQLRRLNELGSGLEIDIYVEEDVDETNISGDITGP